MTGHDFWIPSERERRVSLNHKFLIANTPHRLSFQKSKHLGELPDLSQRSIEGFPDLESLPQLTVHILSCEVGTVKLVPIQGGRDQFAGDVEETLDLSCEDLEDLVFPEPFASKDYQEKVIGLTGMEAWAAILAYIKAHIHA
jgi:hypothetical protein